MFATIKQIDHDTWHVYTDALDGQFDTYGSFETLNAHRRASTHFAHSRTMLATLIRRIANSFEWAADENGMTAGNLVINFGDETTWIDHVWAIADRLHPASVRTHGTAALYTFDPRKPYF